MEATLPTDSQSRKNIPLAEGLLWYFPAALAAVAEVSKAGNDKHNPGQPLHWSRGKSMDHADCIMRHLVDAGTLDPEDGLRHSAKVAWRALALLQEELEREEGAPVPRNARVEKVYGIKEYKQQYEGDVERLVSPVTGSIIPLYDYTTSESTFVGYDGTYEYYFDKLRGTYACRPR